MSNGECSQLVQTVLATHRRCASEGNSFDVNRVLLTLEEHNAILSNSTDHMSASEKDEPRETSSDSIVSCQQMLEEANDAAALLSNITNLRNCGENKLKEMLLHTQQELNLKNGEILKMTKLKDRITDELAELTSCLFEEANRMVNEANRDRHMADQKAKECEMAMALLQEEVKLLKSVAASISPSNRLRGTAPNACGRSQSAASAIISSSNSKSSYSKDGNSDNRKKKLAAAKRNEKTKTNLSVGGKSKYCASAASGQPATHNLINTNRDEGVTGCCCASSSVEVTGTGHVVQGVCREASNLDHLDMKCFNEFLLWRQNPLLQSDDVTTDNEGNEFYEQILTNDIRPCLSFCTEENMQKRLLKACEANLVSIERLNCFDMDSSAIHNNNSPVIKGSPSSSASSSDSPTVSPSITSSQARHCQLSHGMRVCEYKVFIADEVQEKGQSGEEELQHCFIVCRAVRDRIAAVCELLTFLRHVSRNLYTRTESIDLFLKLTHLQAICCLTRLGFISD